MLAYHNDVKIKEDILNQLQGHYEADQIIQGYYWENGKGCAVGCTLHSRNHEKYEERFGIPTQLAYLEDRIFERLPNDLAKEWPLKFMSSINVGADLSKVWPKFVIWLLSDPEYGVIQYTKNEKIIKVIENVINLYKKPLIKPVIETEFISAAAASGAFYANSAGESSAAYAAAYAASAADYAFYADSASAASAGSAAAAAYAAAAAASASASASGSASASAYDFAAAAAAQAHYIAQSDKLIKILKETT